MISFLKALIISLYDTTLIHHFFFTFQYEVGALWSSNILLFSFRLQDQQGLGNRKLEAS